MKKSISYLDQVVGSGRPERVSTLESMGRALNSGFRILKILAIVLAAMFLFSNIYWVSEGSVAVQTRFGEIAGKDGAAIRGPGGPYPAWPYPVDKIVRIPTTVQKVSVHKAFWSEQETDAPVIDDRPETRSLRPGVHGSLITADKNIVQGVWVVRYKAGAGSADTGTAGSITDFITNVGTMEQAEQLIRRIAERAIVRVVSQTRVSEFVAGQIDNRAIQRIIAARLNDLDAGLNVTSVSASHYSVPKALVPDFHAVNQAESQKALEIEKASRHRVSTLNELAGSDWETLLETINDHEQALGKADAFAEKAAFETAVDLYSSDSIGGTVKQTLDEAKTEKTALIQRARAGAARFGELLPLYEQNGPVLESQLVQDAIQEIWSDISVTAVYLPAGQKFFLDLGRQEEMLK